MVTVLARILPWISCLWLLGLFSAPVAQAQSSPFERWMQQLQSPEPLQRQEALQDIHQQASRNSLSLDEPQRSRLVSVLFTALSDTESGIRAKAAAAVGAFDAPFPPETANLLLRIVTVTPQSWTLDETEIGLGLLMRRDLQARQLVLAALQSPEFPIRFAAVRGLISALSYNPDGSLPQFRPQTPAAGTNLPPEAARSESSDYTILIDALLARAADEAPEIRQSIFFNILSLALPVPEFAALLAFGVRDSTPEVHQQAFGAFQYLNHSREAVRDRLVPLLDDPDLEVAARGAKALGLMGISASSGLRALRTTRARATTPEQAAAWSTAIGQIRPFPKWIWLFWGSLLPFLGLALLPRRKRTGLRRSARLAHATLLFGFLMGLAANEAILEVVRFYLNQQVPYVLSDVARSGVIIGLHGIFLLVAVEVIAWRLSPICLIPLLPATVVSMLLGAALLNLQVPSRFYSLRQPIHLVDWLWSFSFLLALSVLACMILLERAAQALKDNERRLQYRELRRNALIACCVMALYSLFTFLVKL